MPQFSAPTKDSRFILHETLMVHVREDITGYDVMAEDMTSQVLEEAGRISSEVLLPVNAIGDREGVHLENGVVRTPDVFKGAWEALKEGGWSGIDQDPEYGGQGMSYLMHAMVAEYMSTAAMAFMMYQGLTHGAVSAIHMHGSDEIKATYLPPMISSDWTGTMNLTEPHCGTDLALLRAKAEPNGDGSYRISGEKIFISAGEHDLTDNIVHLVLARIPGGPEGVKGISLFVVPKFIPKADGTPGERNAVSCGKLEEKMGIHGSSTCVMNYDGATGWLLGDEHKGLRAMFTMMNEARILVGMQGLAQAEGSYQNALAYAKDRRQGRALSGPAEPDQSADPIIVHPDVRRMLMDAKALIEGMRAFYYYCSVLIDSEKHNSNAEKAEADGLMVALLTPVLKGFLTDKGYEIATNMQQVYGGHGYIEEHGMAQYVRDARIAMIYEGANGIQALDLIGRKLPQKGGAAMQAFFAEVIAFCKEHGEGEFGATYTEPLKAASKELQEAVMWFMQNGMKDPNQAAAGSVDFLHMFGHVACAYMWVRMAAAAQKALDGGASDTAFYDAKLKTARYYMSKLLPETSLRLARIKAGAEPVMALDAVQF